MRFAKQATGKPRERNDRRAREKRESVAKKLSTTPVRLPVGQQRSEAVATTRPVGLSDAEWEAVQEFMGPLIEAAELPPDVTRRVLRVVAASAAPALRAGVQLTPEMVLGPDAVTHFLATEGAGMSESSVKQYRTTVRRLGRAIGMPEYHVITNPTPRPGRDAPYTSTERIRYYWSASKITNSVLRADVYAMLDLAFGAGMTAEHGKVLCGTDIRRWAEHTYVRLHVEGDKKPPIERPVPDGIAPRLLARAAEVGTRHMIRPGRSRDRYSEATVDALEGPNPRLSRFVIQRAADAWAVDILERLDLSIIPVLFGVAPSSHTINDLLALTDSPARDRYHTVLNKVIDNQ